MDERYAIIIDFVNDDIGIYYENGSTTTTIAEDTTSCILTEDEWFRVEVDWRTDGTHTVWLYNDSANVLTRLTGSELSVTDGGIGYVADSSDGGSVFIDSILVDGLERKLNSIAQDHDGFDHLESERLADQNGNERMKQTYYFQDGYTHECTVENTSNTTSKMIDNSCQYRKAIVRQEVNQEREMARRAKETARNGGS